MVVKFKKDWLLVINGTPHTYKKGQEVDHLLPGDLDTVLTNGYAIEVKASEKQQKATVPTKGTKTAVK